MTKVTYKAWVDSNVIGAWNDRDAAYHGVLAYLDLYPDEGSTLHFGAFKHSLDTGSEPIFTLNGEDQIREHIADVTA